MTIAQQIAKDFGDNGSTYRDATGRSISERCAALAVWEWAELGCCQYTFEDDSIITVASGDGSWDHGFPDCHCWAGAGHAEWCTGREAI